MTTTAARPGTLALALTLTLPAAACAVDDRPIRTIPDPIIIDTFEDMTTVPTNPRFNAWAHSAYNTGPEARSFGVSQPGFDSDWCMEFDWQVSDPIDGVPNYTGVLVRTQALASIDLTAYTRFTFEFHYRRDQLCQPSQFLDVILVCSELGSKFGAEVPMAEDWTTVSMQLRDFRKLAYLSTTDAVLADCLRVVDAIQFAPSTNLGDGQCGAGHLWVDDVAIYGDVGPGP